MAHATFNIFLDQSPISETTPFSELFPIFDEDQKDSNNNQADECSRNEAVLRSHAIYPWRNSGCSLETLRHFRPGNIPIAHGETHGISNNNTSRHRITTHILVAVNKVIYTECDSESVAESK